jgi:hypothetical protein
MIGLLLASAAVAVPADTSTCATVSPVTSSMDVAGLQRDADCFDAAAKSDSDAGTVLSKAASAARSARTYRLSRIAAIKRLPPPPPPEPPVPMLACDDGKMLPVEARCADGSIMAASPLGLPGIPSEFDPVATLIPTWGHGTIPPSMGGDPLGAFRFGCGSGPIGYFDPIMYPGQDGQGHLHQFYGNTAISASSTFASLRGSGDSTCGSDRLDGKGHPVNRSGYWIPAMLDGKGNVVIPDGQTVYYKRIPDSDPNCHPESNPKAYGKCIPIPHGLRMIAGSDLKGGYRQVHTPPQTPYKGAFRFNCVTAQGLGIAGVSGQYFDIQSVPKCPVGAQFMFVLQFPQCFDGKHVDVAGHGHHVDYMFNGKCPPETPYLMPFFLLEGGYIVREGDDTTQWRLASDDVDPNKPHGWSLHGDYLGAWDPAALNTWTDNCINKHLSCTGGDFGNGTQMQAAVPLHWNPDGTLTKSFTNPRHLVPVPPMPEMK